MNAEVRHQILGDGDKPEGAVEELLELSGSRTDPRPVGSARNALIVLANDARLAGRFRLNLFAQRIEVHRDGKVRQIEDTDATELIVWLDEVYRLKLSTPRAHEAIALVSKSYQYHPVRAYLEGLVWDGVPRIDTWLTDYYGATGPVAEATGNRFLISCVARVMDPGCKVDTTLVLTGDQGAYKSQSIKVLATPWSGDTPLEIGNKDAYQVIAGKWVYEVAELQSFKGREATQVKAFISSQQDDFRPSFGRYSVTQPRQVVFICTTNDDLFLVDSTGHRRYWPVRVFDVDLEGLRRDRDQLWAEALHRYRAGAPWWLDRSEAKAVADASEEFEQRDAWYDVIAMWVIDRVAPFTITEVAEKALGIVAKDFSVAQQMRVGAVLRKLGLTKRRVRVGAAQVIEWIPPRGVARPI